MSREIDDETLADMVYILNGKSDAARKLRGEWLEGGHAVVETLRVLERLSRVEDENKRFRSLVESGAYYAELVRDGIVLRAPMALDGARTYAKVARRALETT